MSPRRCLAVALASGHLFLVLCGAWRIALLPPGSTGDKALRWYGAVSGASTGYGFFAPGVGSQLRARFEMTDEAGYRWTDELDAGHNQEVRLRLGSIINLFPGDQADEALRHDLTASWAGTMFGRHPQAKQVVVHLEIYVVPRMEDYRAGARPQWQPLYQAIFTRRSPHTQETGS